MPTGVSPETAAGLNVRVPEADFTSTPTPGAPAAAAVTGRRGAITRLVVHAHGERRRCRQRDRKVELARARAALDDLPARDRHIGWRRRTDREVPRARRHRDHRQAHVTTTRRRVLP